MICHQDLLALHDKYHKMLTVQFSGHGLFQKALKDAFTEIVNRELPVSRNFFFPFDKKHV